MKRDACVCGCTTPVPDGSPVRLEEPGVCVCGHYLYLHERTHLDE